MSLSTEIFSKRRNIYSWFEEKAEFFLREKPNPIEWSVFYRQVSFWDVMSSVFLNISWKFFHIQPISVFAFEAFLNFHAIEEHIIGQVSVFTKTRPFVVWISLPLIELWSDFDCDSLEMVKYAIMDRSTRSGGFDRRCGVGWLPHPSWVYVHFLQSRPVSDKSCLSGNMQAILHPALGGDNYLSA